MESLDDNRQQLYVFADDLFRYLLSKRINLTDFSPPLRKPDNPTPDFDPVVGLFILCISHRRQKEYFTFFSKEVPLFINERYFQLNHFASFCIMASDHFNATFENIYEKILHIGSVILEICAFCNAQGHKQLKYFSGIVWADMIHFEMELESFNSDNLKELIRFASYSLQAYIDENNDTCVDENRDLKTECLKEYDTWASMLSVDTLNGVSTLDSEPVRLAYVPKRMTQIEILHSDVLTLFFDTIMTDIGPETEEFVSILRNLDSAIKLMNNELYLQVMTQTIKLLGIKLSSFELFQLAKLIIRDNEILAIFCFLTAQYAKGFRTKQEIMNIFSTISSESSNSTDHSRNINAPKYSGLKSSGKSNATSRQNKSAYNEISSKRLLREFKRLIEQDRSTPAKEICKYLKIESKCPILDDILFRKVMQLTCQHYENCWENIWILSVMKLLDPKFKPQSLEYDIAVYKNVPLFNTDVLAETLMGELIAKEGKNLKASEEKNQMTSEQESKRKHISMKHQLRDVFKSSCPGKVDLNKKELASEKKSHRTTAETSRVLQEIYNFKPKAEKTCFRDNYSFPDKLTQNEFARVKNYNSTIKLHQHKQTLISHNDAQSETIHKDIELIKFCSSRNFTEKDFVGPSSSSGLFNEGGNARVSIVSATQIPHDANIFLNPADEEIIIENKQKVCTENLVASTNREIMDLVLPKFKKLEDLVTEMKALSIENMLKSSDINEEKTEKKTESGIKLSNSIEDLLKELSNFQECESKFLSDFVAHGRRSSFTIIPLSQAREDIHRLEDFVTEMKVISIEKRLKSSGKNAEETENKIESELKLSNSMDDISKEFSNLPGCERNLSDSVAHSPSSFTISPSSQDSKNIYQLQDFVIDMKALLVENILKSSVINEEETEKKIQSEVKRSNSMDDLTNQFSNFQGCEVNLLSDSITHDSYSFTIISLPQATEGISRSKDFVTEMKVVSVENKIKSSDINEEETEKKIESQAVLSNSMEDLPKEFSNFQKCESNLLSDSVTHGHSSSFTIIPLSQASKYVNELEDFVTKMKILSNKNTLKNSGIYVEDVTDMKPLSVGNIRKISDINEEQTEKKIESEVILSNSMEDLAKDFSNFQEWKKNLLSDSVTHGSSSFTISPLSQVSKDINQLEDFVTDMKALSVENTLKISEVNEEETEKKIESEVKLSNSMKDLPNQFSDFQECEINLSDSVAHNDSYSFTISLPQASEDINQLQDFVAELKVLSVKNTIKSSGINDEETEKKIESEAMLSNSMENPPKELSNFQECESNFLSDSVARDHSSSFTIIPLSQASEAINELEDFVTKMKILSNKNTLKNSGINAKGKKIESEVKQSNFLEDLPNQFSNIQGGEHNLLSNSVSHGHSSSFTIIPLSQTSKDINQSENFATEMKVLSIENTLKSSDINGEETEKKTEFEVELSNSTEDLAKEFSNLQSHERNLSYSVAQGPCSFPISSLSQASEDINKLEDSVTKIKALSVENILKSLNINEKEIEKEIESEVKPSNSIKEAPKEFSNFQGCNRNLLSDSFPLGHSSLTISPSSHASDSMNHPENISASEQQNSNIPYLQNLRCISRDILSAYRNIMDTLPIDYSRETFNGTLRQIIEKNPDILKTLKVKSIIDKQIMRELLKYRQNFCEMNK